MMIGLHYINIYLCDNKPANLLLVYDEFFEYFTLKITDLGSAFITIKVSFTPRMGLKITLISNTGKIKFIESLNTVIQKDFKMKFIL